MFQAQGDAVAVIECLKPYPSRQGQLFIDYEAASCGGRRELLMGGRGPPGPPFLSVVIVRSKIALPPDHAGRAPSPKVGDFRTEKF